MQRFGDNPTINSPYVNPGKHWYLDEEGKPTGAISPERQPIAKSARDIPQGNSEEDIATLETDGQILVRVYNELLRSKNAIVINDEAHHPTISNAPK